MSFDVESPEAGHRDAIHVAVIGLINTTGKDLEPGTPIKVTGNAAFRIVTKDKANAVVNPFLIESVVYGGRFSAFMMPGTTSGLKHVWESPGIESPVEYENNDDSGCRGCY